MRNILENIREIREKKGYGQEYMANKLGLTQAGYALWESGKREISYNKLLKIAEVLGYEGMDVINIITYPDVYVNPSTVAKSQDKVSVTFEVDPMQRDYLLRLVMSDNSNTLK